MILWSQCFQKWRRKVGGIIVWALNAENNIQLHFDLQKGESSLFDKYFVSPNLSIGCFGVSTVVSRLADGLLEKNNDNYE